MRKPMRRIGCALAALLAAVALQAAAQENLVRNPRFEALDADQKPTSWYCPDYWSGELSSVADPAQVHEGQRAVLLQATEKGGKHWGRIHPATMPVVPGLRYRFSVWARGAGTLKLGAIHYFPERADGTRYEVVWPDTVFPLTDQWQEATYEFSPVSADVRSVATMIEVEGEGAAAYLDDSALAVAREAVGELSVRPTYAMARAGDSVTFSIGATTDGKPLAGGAVALIGDSPAVPAGAELTLDAAGATSYTFSANATETGLVRLSFVQGDIGEAVTAFADVVAADTYDRFAAAARAAGVDPLPAHLLFLGDSLTDFHRGYNYVDQAGFWLGRVYGEQVTVKNAGVGGDYIRRVWQRLNDDPQVYRLEAYDDLYDPKPTRVFIFLGHNDSKLTSGSGFQESVVPPDEFEELYRKAIEKIRQDTGAQITVISSTSSVYEITEPRAQELLKTRGSASLFGKPDVLEHYNAIARKVADDLGCTYLDVYEPTRTHPDKPNLFMPDGVHLNLEGNHLVALELLEHLAE
jgi:lysophospholipase L1-like esterase